MTTDRCRGNARTVWNHGGFCDCEVLFNVSDSWGPASVGEQRLRRSRRPHREREAANKAQAERDAERKATRKAQLEAGVKALIVKLEKEADEYEADKAKAQPKPQSNPKSIRLWQCCQ